jgi:hypothetical protein
MGDSPWKENVLKLKRHRQCGMSEAVCIIGLTLCARE